MLFVFEYDIGYFIFCLFDGMFVIVSVFFCFWLIYIKCFKLFFVKILNVLFNVLNWFIFCYVLCVLVWFLICVVCCLLVDINLLFLWVFFFEFYYWCYFFGFFCFWFWLFGCLDENFVGGGCWWVDVLCVEYWCVDFVV